MNEKGDVNDLMDKEAVTMNEKGDVNDLMDKGDVNDLMDKGDVNDLMDKGDVNDLMDKEANVEYSAQYFGFTAKSFCNGVYNATAEYIAEGMCELTAALREQTTEDEDKKEVVDVCAFVHRDIIDNLDKYFDKLEGFLRDMIFSVAPNVQLSDTNHGLLNDLHGVDLDNEEARLDREIAELTHKIHTVHDSTQTMLADKVTCKAHTVAAHNMHDSIPQTEVLHDLVKNIEEFTSQVTKL